MKTNKTIIIALLTLAISSAHAAETTIDFEANDFLAVGSAGTASITYENVTFSGIGRTSPSSNIFFRSSNAFTGVNNAGITDTYLESGFLDFQSIHFSFDTSVTEFSFNFANNINDWNLIAYDDTGTLIDSELIGALENPPADGHSGTKYGLTSSALTTISYATLTNMGGAITFGFEDTVVIDNFTYNTSITSPIPEPSTYLLMMGGLGMVGFMAYRRRKTANA